MGDSGDRAQSDLLSAAKATWSTPWPYSSSCDGLKDNSSRESQFLQNLICSSCQSCPRCACTGNNSRAKDRLSGPGEPSLILLFIALFSKQLQKPKKTGAQADLSLKLLPCSDLHPRWSLRWRLCCSPPRRHRPRHMCCQVSALARHMCCQVSGTWLFSILFTCVVITVILKVVYFRLKSGVRKAELRGPSRQVRL